MNKEIARFIKWEISPRWVKGEIAGETIVNSKQAMLVWEHEKYPFYYFPKEDIQTDFLEPTGRGHNGRQTWHIKVGSHEVNNAAYGYLNLKGEAAELNGLICFRWDKVDHWFEEAEEVFVHARDPYKRIDTLQSTRHIKVVIDGLVVAEDRQPYLLFETGLPTRYYLHPDDVKKEHLTATSTRTQCPYKGEAVYWTVRVNGREYKDLVWSYPDPIPEIPKIKGLLCFFNEKVDIYVDGELEQRPITPWS